VEGWRGGKKGRKKFVATNRNKGKLIKRVDETFVDIWGDVDRIIDNVKGGKYSQNKKVDLRG